MLNPWMTPWMTSMDVSDFMLSAHKLSHRVPSFAYGFRELNTEKALDTEKLRDAGIPSGPDWGRLQNGEDVRMSSGELIQSADYLLASRKPRKVIIGGDNDTPELLKVAVDAADVLIHEATYTDEVSIKVGPGPQHSSAKKVAQFAAGTKIKNLILTHFSARYQYGNNQSIGINEIENEAKIYYSGQLFLANDFDQFHLTKTGELILIESKYNL